MKTNKYLKLSFIAIALAFIISALGLGYPHSRVVKEDNVAENTDTALVEPGDSVVKRVSYIPAIKKGSKGDSVMIDTVVVDLVVRDNSDEADQPKPHMIYLLVRGYEDNVRLRWAPSDYFTWNMLNKAGYIVKRLDNQTLAMDTVAVVKPLTVDGFKARFNADDDMAAAAAQVIWGDHSTDNTIDAQESNDPLVAASAAEDLDQIFSTAMVLAELRFDIAQAMGLGVDDRNVEKGHTYTYIVSQNLPRDDAEIYNNPQTVKVGTPFKAEKLDIAITDSVSAPRNVTLYWPYTTYTVYDIQRRLIDGTQADWVVVNKNPYLMLKNLAMPQDNMIQYTETPPAVGEYEYRIIGYDSFGTPSLPSDPHKVSVPDMVPPRVPMLSRIIVDHPDVDHAEAHIYFFRDSIEDDLLGYMPLYRPRVKLSDNALLNKEKQDKKTQKIIENAEIIGEWHPLINEWIYPTDTVFHCDVSGLPSGDIRIVASDKAGNINEGIEQFIFLEDFKAPTPPDSLRANVAPNGYVVLRWNPSPDLDVRNYEVYFANDTTHTFMKLPPTGERETIYLDSIAPGLNQAFIYYEVRAVDYSGNTSLPSKRLRVVRPNFLPPHPCRIDSLYNDEMHVYMRWIQPDEQDLAYTRLLKRKRPSKDWEVVAVYPADSVRAQGNFICITEHPIPDMKNRYEYAMEAYNLNGVSSGLSLVSSVLHTGPRVLNLPINLMGNYKVEDNETVLAWELKTAPEALPSDEWWYCVYRKIQGESLFEFVISTPKTENFYSDNLLKPGQTAEYYVKIRLKDGRFSKDSNTIKVTAPKAKDL